MHVEARNKSSCLLQRFLSDQPCRPDIKTGNALSINGSMQQCKQHLPFTTGAREPCSLHLMTGNLWSARVVFLWPAMTSDPATPRVLSSVVATSLLVIVGLAALSTGAADSEEANGPATTSISMMLPAPANQSQHESQHSLTIGQMVSRWTTAAAVAHMSTVLFTSLTKLARPSKLPLW